MKSYEIIIRDCGGLIAGFLAEGDTTKAATVSAAFAFALRRVFEEKTGQQIMDEIETAAKKIFLEAFPGEHETPN